MLALATNISQDNGIGVYGHHFVAALGRVRPSWRCTVLTMQAEGSGRSRPPVAVRVRSGKPAFAAAALLLSVRRRPGHIVVFHVHLLPLARLCAAVSGATVTVVAHGWDVSRNRDLLQRAACGPGVRTVAVSRWTALEVEQFRLRRPAGGEPTSAILPGTYDEATYHRRPGGRFRARLGLTDSDTLLVSVGRLDPAEQAKGQDRVVRLLPRLLSAHPRIKYLIVGRGEDRPRLEALVADTGVQEAVRFLGFVEDLAECYSACDLFVLPSTQEGLGLVFLEAMACGLPVVAGGTDGSVSAVDWGRMGFLCDPCDPESIEAAILDALAGRGGSDRRCDPAFLTAEVRAKFGTDAFDRRLDAFLASG